MGWLTFAIACMGASGGLLLLAQRTIPNDYEGIAGHRSYRGHLSLMYVLGEGMAVCFVAAIIAFAACFGVFHYEPRTHALRQTRSDDIRKALFKASLRQAPVHDAPAVFVIAGVVERTARKYGERAERYVYMETGHAAQNLLRQAVAMGLAAVPIGAFEDEAVHRTLELPTSHRPLYLAPVGRPVR